MSPSRKSMNSFKSRAQRGYSHAYEALADDEKQPITNQNQSERCLSSRRWTFLKHFLSILVTMIISFAAGHYFPAWKQSTTDLDSVTFPKNIRTFHYNRTFSTRSSSETNRAWAELFPRQGGYFRHPVIAPTRSAFAVFHQLHCLDGIRQGYWLAFDAANAGQKKTEEDYPFMTSPSHIRHCIDLIRNSLMCQPDLTTEIKDETKGGVTGFGVEHQCVNWESLLTWVGQWESYDQSSDQHIDSTGNI